MASSYRQIFRATSVLGGAQVTSILFGVIRNKFLAVALGPAGVGLAGILTSVTSLVGTVTGLGIPMSGVRQIANSTARNEERQVAVTVTTLRIITWVAGLIGMCAVIAFAVPIARLTFGNTTHAWALAVVAVVVLIEGLGATQKAILQGMRQISALSACQVLGAVGGTIAAVPLVLIFGDRGVAGFLVVAAASATLASWWFARQIRLTPAHLTRGEFFAVFRSLLNVGIAVVVTGIIGAALLYLIRLFVIKEMGLENVGLFQGAWTLSATYVGVVLGAMGTDFYPRLTAVAEDHPAANRLINEQTEMGMLITFPGVLATIVLAPWILSLVYSKDFVKATEVIRWQILGDALKVVSWPLGFISLAKGRGGLFMLTEGTFAMVQLALFYFCIHWRGLEGTGIAMFLFYAVYVVGILMVARRLTGFYWTANCRKTLMIVISVTGTTFALCRFAPTALALPGGVLLTVLGGWWSLKRLNQLLGRDFLASVYNKIAQRLRAKSGDTAFEAKAALQSVRSGDPVIQWNERRETAPAAERAGFEIIDGEQVYYVFHQAARPTAQILLPGHFVTERHFAYAPWVRWARCLAAGGVSALRFDYRGCGESTGIFDNFTMASWLKDCRHFYEFLRRENPDVPIVMGGIGLGGLFGSKLFEEGLGDAMLLWSPAASGQEALRDTLLRRLAFDMSNPASGTRTKSWGEYVASLERGESIEAAGYVLSPALWREAVGLKLALPEGGRTHGTDVRGRPWRVVKLGQSEVPLVPGGGLWQALNPRLRMRRAPLNPDLQPFFQENVRWIQTTLNEALRKV